MDSYNCQNATQSAYGSGGYGTCSTVGAPNTGFFNEMAQNGSLIFILPIAFAVIATSAALIYSALRKRRQANNQG